ITDALAERLGVDMAAAESTKLTMSLPVDASFTDAHPASRALESAAAQWIEELRQSLDYFAAQAGSIRPRRLVLTGGGAQLEGLAQRVATAVRLPVVVASPLAGLKLGKT